MDNNEFVETYYQCREVIACYEHGMAIYRMKEDEVDENDEEVFKEYLTSEIYDKFGTADAIYTEALKLFKEKGEEND
jgi:hypothetical protein